MSIVKTHFGYGRFHCFVIKTTALAKGSKYETDYDYKISGVVLRVKNSLDRIKILSVSSKVGIESQYLLDARTSVLVGCTGKCKLLLSFFLRRYIVSKLKQAIANSEIKIIS